MIKQKKTLVADADVELTKLEHDIGVLKKEKVAATNFVTNLEKQFEWIKEDKESVRCAAFGKRI